MGDATSAATGTANGEGRSRIAPKPLAAYTLATGVSVIAGSVVAAS